MLPQIEPFTVPPLTEQQKQSLSDRINQTIWPNELDESANVGWAYGAPTWAVRQIANHWLHNFNWEIERAQLNEFHHYKMLANGLNVHFIHEPSSQPNARPLVLIHGWPGSFCEFRKVIAPLRDGVPGQPAFHVVVVSLPGYGFSEAPSRPGFGIGEVAKTINEVMINLGYDKYTAQGGDWGSMIGKWLGIRYTENCIAYHTNMPMTMPPLPTPVNLFRRPFAVLKLVASLVTGLEYMYPGIKLKFARGLADAHSDQDAGYRAIQGTRPYTLSYGLSDSPIGLMGWFLEKFHNWTYFDGPNEEKILPPTITTNEFLTNITLYWMTNTISSSLRIYYEFNNNAEEQKVSMQRVSVPMGAAIFSNEVVKLPKEWFEACCDLKHFSTYPVGGHFAAMEEPVLLVEDIRQFVQKLQRPQ
ncbi:hypothetical protein H0H92_010872 [Tricholoma furcatifolium]|nr:hypothetical protein H0H92_010872 [Tricholoma furcatifolium]